MCNDTNIQETRTPVVDMDRFCSPHIDACDDPMCQRHVAQ